jgi:chromate reductase, NAD(P)H dehydrogenase (quinone)
MKRVAILVGSLRRESINLKFAVALRDLAKPELHCDLISLADLPIYNDDLWQDAPPHVVRFKNDIRSADAVLFVTPEYNRSIPPVLKNAIDWGSRPKQDNVWKGKPGAVVGASPGLIGTAVAQSHLRYVAGVVGISLLPLPEVYLSLQYKKIDSILGTSETDLFLREFITAFREWIQRLS